VVQKKPSIGVGPIMLGFFLFVVVGSGEDPLSLYLQNRTSLHKFAHLW
jgi:Ribosome associated membrane protein RAMP4